MHKRQQIILGIIFMLALVLAVSICAIAFQENLTGEYYECSEGPGERQCHVRWDRLLWLGGTWFVIFATIGGTIYGCAKLTFHIIKYFSNKNSKISD